MTVKVVRENKKLKVFSPYNSGLPREAREIGGKWDGEAWVFDIRNEEMVKDLYMDVYGQYDKPVDLVSIKLTAERDVWADRDSIYFAGRKIVSAWGRDTGAKTGDGVALQKGVINSGGSMKNWTTELDKGSVLIIHDVPASLVEPYIENPEKDGDFKVEILGPVTKTKEDLLTEKKALEKRLSEIEKELINIT